MLAKLYKPSLALLTDLYQLTMAYGYWKLGVQNHDAVFHLHFRKNPFKGGYTISMDTVQPTVTKLNVAHEFYSVDYPPLRKLHHDYIFHVLDELGDMPSVIFTVAYQYAGPLAFEQFFQDVAREWEAKHGKPIRIALTTGKGTNS